MKNKKVYTADFETRNSDIDISNNETSVWLYDICDIETFEHKTGTNLEDFMKDLEQIGRATIYFHNMSGFDGNFILYYLLSNGYEYNEERKVKTHTFQTLTDDFCTIYNIKICYDDGRETHKNQQVIEIRDSARKIQGSEEQIAKDFKLPVQKGLIEYKKYRPADYEPTAEEIEYIHHDTEIIARVLNMEYKMDMTHLTSASDTFNLYKKWCGSGFNIMFPVLSIEIDDYIRQSYRGGVCQVNEEYAGKEVYEPINVYDVNSMYPYQMCSQALPYSRPKKFKGKYKKDEVYPLYIQHIICRCELKKGMRPTVLEKGLIFSKPQYLVEALDDPIDLYLTNIDLELFMKHYTIYDIEYIDGYKFKGSRKLFKGFIMPIYKRKAESVGAERQLYKILLNSLYGKFATNPRRVNKVPYIDKELDRIAFRVTEEIKEKPIYTAVASFITAYARKQLFDVIDNVDKAFIYCDTDSCHILNDVLPPEYVDNKEIGKWKLEETFIHTKYIGQKAYMGETTEGIVITRCAGAPKDVRDLFDFENFNVGEEFDGKLLPKKVKGGVVLVDTKFTIKPR